MPISNSIDHLFEANVNAGTTAVNILDESVATGGGKKFKVLCTVDASFIALALLNTRETKFMGLDFVPFAKPLTDEQLASELISFSQNSSILKSVSYESASVQISTPYTFIPSSLFHKEDAEKCFYLNHPKKSASRIESEPIRNFDAVNIFSVSEKVSESIRKVFSNATLHHHITGLLQAIRLMHGKENKKMMHVNFRSDFIDVIVTEGKQLILCNTFNYKSTEDAVYYILTICEQLALNPASIDLVLTGEIAKDAAIVQLLKKYVSNVGFAQRLPAAQFTYGFDKVPSHFYFSVFSHALCEL